MIVGQDLQPLGRFHPRS